MDRFHLIGIKGTGMSALAGVLKDLEYEVMGSDYDEEYFTTQALKNKNVQIFSFNEDNITNDKIYIASHAYDEKNIEIAKVKRLGYPLYYYSEFIEKFFKQTKIGVSGTHGKTTVTTILKSLLPKGKTTYLIGDGNGGGIKDYQYFVFEACEYKNNFHRYTFDYLIINNIELDHPDFFKSIDEVIESFQVASNNSKYLIINGDDLNTQKINHPNKITFGFNKDNDIYGIITNESKSGYLVDVYIKDQVLKLNIPYPGKHMIYNFLAGIATVYLLGLLDESIQERIINFEKPKRRQEEFYYYDNVIIDDYAHHPTEIKACLNAIKQKYPDKDLVVIFQPHTYSRTLELLDEFIDAFSKLDMFYLEKTFTSVREKHDKKKEEFILKSFENAKRFNRQVIKKIKKMKNSCIVFLGAGDVNKYIKDIL